MRATAMPRILIVLGLLVLCVQAQAQLPSASTKPDPWGKKVNLEVSNMALSDALQALFKDSGISYVIEAGVGSPTVTLVLKDVTLRTALEEITRAAGGIYVDASNGDLVRITRYGSPRGMLSPMPVDPSVQEAMITSVFTPTYLSAPELASVLSGPEVGAQTTNNGKLILTGTEESIDKAAKMMRALDVPPPELQPYRIVLSAKITLNEDGHQLKPFELTSESVGLEGERILLEINSRKTATLNSLTPGKVAAAYTVERDVSVSLRVAPPESGPSDSAGALRLTGDGFLHLGERRASYDKKFEFALCAQPGERVVIARAGSDFGDMSAQFEVSVTVTPEKGKVPRPTRLPQPGAPGLGPYGGNYGGGGYGGAYGGGYGGPGNTAAPPALQPKAPGGKPPRAPGW